MFYRAFYDKREYFVHNSAFLQCMNGEKLFMIMFAAEVAGQHWEVR